MVSNNFWWYRSFQKICKYLEKYYMKIKFESYDNLLTNDILNMHQVVIIISGTFAQNGKFYPQLCLDDGLYKL